MNGPLTGIRVVDLTRVLAGPFCAMVLADLGAEVIKIERPVTGDDSRAYPPFQNETSAYFVSVNRGKKSVTMNLKDPAARDLLLRLVEKSDIFIENFKPGVTDRLGLSYEELEKINPRIIYGSSCGFGQTGPYRNKASYDIIIQGMSGMMSITGPDADHPTKVGSSIADIVTGLYLCISVLAALNAREKTGKGQKIDVAMMDCMVSILENALARYTCTGTVPVPVGNVHPSIAPFFTAKTKDHWINIAVGNQDLWRKYCDLIGLSVLAEDERFCTNERRVEHWAALKPILEAAMREKSRDEWLALFEKDSIPSGPIYTMSDVVNDAQIAARQMILNIYHTQGGEFQVPGIPMKFSDTVPDDPCTAPMLGEHNQEIYLGLLGLSCQEYMEMKEKGVI